MLKVTKTLDTTAEFKEIPNIAPKDWEPGIKYKKPRIIVLSISEGYRGFKIVIYSIVSDIGFH